ncbi:parallel beta helix pectate lyase-like protein, partial [Rhizobium subbaraonis]
MAIAPITVGDVDSINKINQAIEKANLVDGKAEQAAVDAKASQTALDAEVSARTSAVTALQAQVNAKASKSALDTTNAAVATKASQADLDMTAADVGAGNWSRPGEAGRLWTQQVEGNPGQTPPLPTSMVAVDSEGSVVRVTGAKTVGPIRATRIEPGRIYRVRFVVRRRENPADPSSHTVRLAVRWLARGKGALSTAMGIVQDIAALTVAGGRTEISAVIARSAGVGVNLVAPSGAVYFRPFVQTYGDDGVTDIEVVDVVDITDAVSVPVDVGQFESRVEALESADAATRLDEVESQLGGAQLRDYLTRDTVASATVSETVDAIRVMQYDLSKPVAPTAYRRAAVEPPYGGVQSADGAWWEPEDAIQIDTRSFGVNADGTDQRVSIQKAIDFVAAKGGGTVLLPRGTIMIGGVGLAVPSNITIQGAGKGITIIKRVAGATCHALSIQTFAENVRISDLTVDGNKQAEVQGSMPGYHAIRGAGTRSLVLERLHVKNAIYYGIGLQGVENFEYDVRITDCDVEACGGWSNSGAGSGDGIDIKSAHRVWLTRVRSWGNAQKGFDPRAYLLEMTDCHAEGNGDSGIHVRGRGDLSTTVRGKITIKGGSSVGNAVNGIVVSQDEPTVVADVSISGMKVLENAANGILIYNSISITVEGCISRDNGGTGIRSTAEEGCFTGNRLMNNGTYGFDGAAQNNRNIVSGNICLG